MMESPCCVTAAVKAIQDGLGSAGGRVYVVSSSHATVGYGALSRGRERINLYGTRDEMNLYGYASTVIQVLNFYELFISLVVSVLKMPPRLQY